MKKHLETIFGTLRSTLLATLTLAIIFGPGSAMAAINTANWDIGGTGQTASSITINAYAGGSVTLTKVAYLAADDSPLADGATVAAGTNVKYMIYVRNTNGFQMNDISIQDVLDLTEFTMVTAANFQYDISQLDTATEAQIFTAVNGAATTYSFATGDDQGSYQEAAGLGTLNIGSTGGDTVLDIPANRTFAIIFTASVLQ